MENITFQAAQKNDFSMLAEWLVKRSQEPEQHCLHTWSGQSVEGLQEQLMSYWRDGELCYLMALRDGKLIGAMGSEYDRDLGRAWLHGPHAALENWGGLAGELYRRLLAELPEDIRQWDAYLNVENSRGRRFYSEMDFKERDNYNYDFWLIPDERVVSSGGGSKLLKKEQEHSFKHLYEVLFPQAYYRAERIVQMIGRSHQVLIEAEGETVLGFAVVGVEGDESVGELQFFGVREESRGRGYGRKLLLSAVDWLLDSAAVTRVCLNVGEELVHARGLYESVGFRLRFTGIGMERKL
jgi:GNAT superfamily N-acetyltransferase